MKKVVFVNQSSGYIMTDIVNAYANVYDEVVLMCGNIKENERSINSKVKIDSICAYDRTSAIKRILTWINGTFQIYQKLRRNYEDWEVIYVTNPPMGYLCSLRLNNPFSIIVFDTYPDALVNIGIRKGNPIYSLWSKWNSRLFANAKSIFTLSNGMADRLSNYVCKDKIKVVSCWSANSNFRPIDKVQNPFVSQHNLQNKFVVMYSGNMGITHNVQLLIQCALRLRANTRIHFMLIGDGAKRKELERIADNENLNNCTFLDWLPADQLPYSLAAADLGVITINDETALVSVPSKTFNLLAVGAPLLCIAPKQSEIANMVAKYDNGRTFDVSEIEDMVEYIIKLSNDNNYRKTLSIKSLRASKDFTYNNANQYLI